MMARVALRTLTREIEDQIEHGQIDQAIANCKHILTFFPKHIDSYRLLGKAFMEGQRYGDATDVFQRVLSSVPEDFIAHLGMSIIQEDEGNLDDAIWHMERAFEMQPSNSAVQGELRRLYGRRDGLEPPKVRLTRGALARMYVKGGLYPQAITELRAALADEAQRPDLLTLLAKAYYFSGQKVEAADTCSSLLSRLPYSLEGNRLLAEILSGSERANEAETYRQRVQALDPYSAHVSASMPNPENVPDGAVTLERLDWKPGQTSVEAPSQPEWAASLGVNVAGLTIEKETLPDWLSVYPSNDREAAPSIGGEPGEAKSAQPTEEAPGQPESPDSSTGLTGTIGEAVSGAGELGAAGLAAIGLGAAGLAASGRNEDEEIPDWMREAGWEASTGAANEGQTPNQPEEPFGDDSVQGEELAPADIPDWLRSMAPQGGSEVFNQTGATSEPPLSGEEGEPPPDFEPGTPGDILPWLSENPPGATDSVVTWLENKEAKPGDQENSAPGEPETGAGQIPEWLRDIEESGPESGILTTETTDDSSDLPEWLSSSPAEGNAEEVPDWLKGMVESSTEPVINPLEETPTNVETTPAEEPVEWQAESASEPPAATEEEGEVPIAEPNSGLPLGAGGAAAFAWLAGKAEGQEKEEGLVEKPEEPQDTTPEWMQVNSDQVKTGIINDQDGTSEEQVMAASELPDWLQVNPDQVETGANIDHDDAREEQAMAASELPDWLRGLAVGAGEGEGEVSLGWEESEEASLQPGEPDNLLDWLKEVDEPPASEGEESSGLASLEEPPIAEEDTKPTRISQATEVSIPATLIGFVAGAEAISDREETSEGPEEAKVEPLVEGVSQAEALEQPGEVEELPAETSEEVLQAFEEGQAGEPEEEHPEEGAGLTTETLVPGIATAAMVAGKPETEEQEETIADQAVSEDITSQEPESIGLPDWLRELEEEPETPWEPSAWAVEEAGQPSTEEPVSEAEPLDEEAAFAWLEGLATRQGADEGLLVSPEERQEAPPDWVAAESAAQFSEAEAESPGVPEEVIENLEPSEVFEQAAEVPAFVTEEPVPEKEAAEPESVPAEDSGGVLKGAAAAAAAFAAIEAFSETPEEASPEEGSEEMQAPTEPVPTPGPLPGETPAEEIPELPSWLAGYEQAPVEEELTWTPPATLPTYPEEQAVESEAEEQAGRPERLDLNQAALIDLERVPGIGFVRAQALLAYRETNGPFTSIGDLQNVPGFDADTLFQIQDKVRVVIPFATEGMPVDDHQVTLIQARNSLAQGDRDQALDYYSGLVKKRVLLPDVIQDLHEALYRFPVDVSIWQTLGDAYARNNQLQEAIDAYTKAEELLR